MDDYQDLIDARDAAIAMRDVASGAMPTIPDAAVDAYLAAPTPLAFWRQYRGVTAAELAGRAGISLSSLNQLENGDSDGSVGVYGKMAAALGVRIDDLVESDRQ